MVAVAAAACAARDAVGVAAPPVMAVPTTNLRRDRPQGTLFSLVTSLLLRNGTTYVMAAVTGLASPMCVLALLAPDLAA